MFTLKLLKAARWFAMCSYSSRMRTAPAYTASSGPDLYGWVDVSQTFCNLVDIRGAGSYSTKIGRQVA